jgi:D-alanine-D-alanine ligase
MTKILLIADVYPYHQDSDGAYYQEWESKDSLDGLISNIKNLNYDVDLISSYLEKDRFVHLLRDFVTNKKNDIIIWNLVEGYFSRNREAYIPSICEYFGIPFIGSDTYINCITLDKSLMKDISNKLNIHTANYKKLLSKNLYNINLDLHFPLFLKPNGEGSSLGISDKSIIVDKDSLLELLNEMPIHYFPLMLEEYLPGKEYTIGVLSDGNKYQISELCEVVLDGVYSEIIKSKSTMPEKIQPSNLDMKTLEKIKRQTMEICEEIQFYGYGRLDWKMDTDQTLHFLEFNSTPGLSSIYSSLPKCFEISGIDYSKLIEIIIENSQNAYFHTSRAYGKKYLGKNLI